MKNNNLTIRDTDPIDEEIDEERDDTKRKSRNLSEKRRRDQFNVLVNELCFMVSNSTRKLDKSTVLIATINFLKTHNGMEFSMQMSSFGYNLRSILKYIERSAQSQSQVEETQENWKPSFLSSEEFSHLMMEVCKYARQVKLYSLYKYIK